MPPIYQDEFLVKAYNKLPWFFHSYRNPFFKKFSEEVLQYKNFKIEIQTLKIFHKWFSIFPDLLLMLRIYDKDFIKLKNLISLRSYGVIENWIIYEIYFFFSNFCFDYFFYLKNIISFYFNNITQYGLYGSDFYFDYFCQFFNLVHDYFGLAFLTIPFFYYFILFYQIFLDNIFYFIQDFFIYFIKLRFFDFEFLFYTYVNLKQNILSNMFYNIYCYIFKENIFLDFLRSIFMYIYEFNIYMIMVFKKISTNFLSIFNFKQLNSNSNVLNSMKNEFVERFALRIDFHEKKNIFYMFEYIKKKLPKAQKPTAFSRLGSRSLWYSVFPSKDLRFSDLGLDKAYYAEFPKLKFKWISLGDFFDNNLFSRFKLNLFEKILRFFQIGLYLLVIYSIFGIYLFLSLKRSIDLLMNEVSYKLLRLHLDTRSKLDIYFNEYWVNTFNSIIKRGFNTDDTFYDFTDFYLPEDPIAEADRAMFIDFYIKTMLSIARPLDRYSKYEKLNLNYRILRLVDTMGNISNVYSSFFKALYKHKHFRYKYSRILNFFIYCLINIYGLILYSIIRFEFIENIKIFLTKYNLYNIFIFKLQFFKDMFIISNSNLIFFGNNFNLLMHLFYIEKVYKAGIVLNCLAKMESNLDITYSYRKSFVIDNSDLLSNVKLIKFYKQIINFSFKLNERYYKFFIYRGFNNVFQDLRSQIPSLVEENEEYFRRYIYKNQNIYILSRMILFVSLFSLIFYGGSWLLDFNNYIPFQEALEIFLNYIQIYFNFLFKLIMLIVWLIFKFIELSRFLYYVFSHMLPYLKTIPDFSTLVYFKALWLERDYKPFKFSFLIPIRFFNFFDFQNVEDVHFTLSVDELEEFDPLYNVWVYWLDDRKQRGSYFNFFFFHKVWATLMYIKYVVKSWLKYTLDIYYEAFFYNSPLAIFVGKDIRDVKKEMKTNIYEYYNEDFETINELEPNFYNKFMYDKIGEKLKKEKIFVKSWLFRNKSTWNRFERSFFGEATLSPMAADQWPQVVWTFKSLVSFLRIFNFYDKNDTYTRWVDPYERSDSETIKDPIWYIKRNIKRRFWNRKVTKKKADAIGKFLWDLRSKFKGDFRRSTWDIEKYLERPFHLTGIEKRNPILNVWDVYINSRLDRRFEHLSHFLQEALWRAKYTYHRVFGDAAEGLTVYYKLPNDKRIKSNFEKIHRDKAIGSAKDWQKFKSSQAKWYTNYYSRGFYEDFARRKMKDSYGEYLSKFYVRSNRYNHDINYKLKYQKTYESLFRSKREHLFMQKRRSLLYSYMNEGFYKRWNKLRNDRFNIDFDISRNYRRTWFFFRRKNHVQRLLVWQSVSRVVKRTQVWKLLSKETELENTFIKQTKFFDIQWFWKNVNKLIDRWL